MKANRATTRRICGQAGFGAALLVLLASCAPPPGRTAPLPPPPARPQPHAPIARPNIAPPVLGWRNTPITPGFWRWSQEGGASVAQFGSHTGAPLLALRCDRSTHSITLERAGGGEGPVSMSVSTSTMTRPLLAEPRSGGLVVVLSPRDSLLDAMAFSRGSFAIEVQGMPALYVPSAPELSRVIEDCR